MQQANAGPMTDRTHELLQTRLQSGLKTLGVGLTEPQQLQLLDFIDLLVKWNGVYNLTAVRDAFDMLSVHVLDALSIVDLVDRLDGNPLLDVGSGAGIPAIPLAIARPTIAVHSIDAVAKKIGFQLQTKTTLKLANLHPVHSRIEAATLPEPPAIIVSRAFADLATMLRTIDHLADGRTRVVAMKGKTPVDELAALPSGWVLERIEDLDVPFLGAQRCAVVLRRVPGGH